MEIRDRFRPEAPPALALTIDEVQRAIDRLGREDRASLRPWILARYDVRGYRSASTFAREEGSERS